MKNIELNFQRLSESKEYAFENIFQKEDYDWYGDWEGRALLAFVCHYQIHGKKIPCMDELVKALPLHINSKLYFGPEFNGITVDEQQLSGHSWFLRGLIKYTQAFQNHYTLQVAKSIVENLYLPVADWYQKYPLKREGQGGVCGMITGIESGWKLSSDVGCAFMCVDGLAHYYEYTKDMRVKVLLDKILEVFFLADYVKSGFQTHTTLSCARGILTLYKVTNDKKYLEKVEEIFENYVKYGMTLTYENFNWFGREDTWTEPCAVVDSFILATELYKITVKQDYLTFARRIWFNGLQFCQRPNGGAGPNTCVKKGQPVLKVFMYEAPFCCTMRYAEGLLTYVQNESLFVWNEQSKQEKDEYGRVFINDKMLIKVNGEYVPIFAGYTLSKEELENMYLEVMTAIL